MASRDEFLETAYGGYKKAYEPSESDRRLVQVYKKAFRERYGIEPIVEDGGSFVLSVLKKHAPGMAEEIVEHYLSMNDEWFLKKGHDLPTLKSSLNLVMGSLGHKRRREGKEPFPGMQNVRVREGVEDFLYYLWESQMVMKAYGLLRKGDTLVTLPHGTHPGGIVISRDAVEAFVLPYRGAGLSIHDLREIFLTGFLAEIRA